MNSLLGQKVNLITMVSGVQLGVIVSVLFAVITDCICGGGTPWATPDQEALDEVRDAEILKAVVTSMREWNRRRVSHRRKRAESSVCYPEVGCFQDSGPFSYLDMLPSPPEEVSTKFFLYSGRSAPAMEVPFTNLSNIWPLARKTFNISAPTKVIVHGFGGSCGHVWVYEMRSALMTVEESNLICVDWEAGAVIPNYVRAAANTRLVGKQLSLLLDGLNKHLGLPIHNVHIIGFSLGAHVAGFAGAELKNLSRITGLDPAAPLFESQDPRARLDSTDAMFVDVIHSNGENLILGGLGSWQPMGHVDFYPNGGRMQKGCTNLFVGAVTDILWSASDVEGRSLCNHRRAYKFFTDSVSPRCHFPSFPCESYDKFLAGECFPCNGDRQCGNMGYYADRSSGRGTLFLITREEEPFCAHQYHVRIENSQSPVPVTSYGKIELTLIGSTDINETMTLTQKDDDELKMGSSLARIAVPHPVLQEPRSVEIMYTAYSGWISSGLSSWSVDKVTLTDSFGKSMSVCKKGLVLESGIPVILPLYPGECNPPRDNVVKEKDTSSSTASSADQDQAKPSKEPLISTIINNTTNFTQFTPTPVLFIGDELLVTGNSTKSTGSEKKDKVSLLDSPHSLESIPWQPIDILDSSNTNTLDGMHNKRESARSFNTFLTNVILHNVTSNTTDDTIINTPPSQSNLSEATTTTERPEIKEPVLIPSSSPHPSIWPRDASLTKSALDVAKSINLTSQVNEKPEITEPVLNPKKPTTTSPGTEIITPRPSMVKPREISKDTFGNYHSEQSAKWMPAVELNPPPLGGTETWQHWLTETTASSSLSSTTSTSILEDKSFDTSNNTQGDGRRLGGLPSTSKVTKKSSPITIQFFPQRLAALLAQAEHYARLTLSFPISAMSKLMYNKSPPSENQDSDQETSASTNKLYTLNLPEELLRRNSNLQTQRRPKHFTTVRPTNSENSTSVPSQKFSNKSGKIHEMQPRMDKLGNLPLVKEITQKDNVYVPFSYSYSTQDNTESTKHKEESRFIPLLRYSESNKRDLKYEISQNYSKVSNVRPSSTKVPAHVNVKKFNNDKEGDNDYNSYYSDTFRHAYPTVPER